MRFEEVKVEECLLDADVLSVEDMAIRKEDREWIAGEIASQIGALEDRLRPRGWRRALLLGREWGVLAVNATIIVTLGIFAATQFYAANKRLADEARFEEKTDGRLGTIEKDLVSLRVLIASSQPTRKQNQDAARELIAEAKKSTVPPIPDEAIRQAAKSFIDVKKDPKAWGVALDFVSYRSSRNLSSRPKFPEAPTETGNSHYTTLNVLGKPPSQVSYGLPIVLAEQAARYDFIGKDQNAGLKSLPSWLVLTGGATNIDGMQVKNVVFEGVEIHYSGRPVILQNVIFINCTFSIEHDDAGERLAESILDSATVNFTGP